MANILHRAARRKNPTTLVYWRIKMKLLKFSIRSTLRWCKGLLFTSQILLTAPIIADIDLASGDSITVGGQRISCDLGGNNGSCRDVPGRQQCDDWAFVERRMVRNDQFICSEPISCMPVLVYTQQCRTFDGCGTPTGTFEKSENRGTGWIERCQPCN